MAPAVGRGSLQHPCDAVLYNRGSLVRAGQPGVLPCSVVAGTLVPLAEQAGAVEFLGGHEGYIRVSRPQLDIVAARAVRC